MTRDLLELLCCPGCRGDLTLSTADAAALHIVADQWLAAFFLELGTVRAGHRAELDELHVGIRIAHQEATLRRANDHFGPVATVRDRDGFDHSGHVGRTLFRVAGRACEDRRCGEQNVGWLHQIIHSET